MAETVARGSLGEQAASQLANVTKTAPIYGAITPRWLVRLLDWKPLEAGIFRRNRVVEDKVIEVLCGHVDESEIPGTYAEYEETPREYRLSSINSVLNVQTRVSDLFSNPYDQVREQLRVVHPPRVRPSGRAHQDGRHRAGVTAACAGTAYNSTSKSSANFFMVVLL